MTPNEERELLRLSILRVLTEKLTRFGVPIAYLLASLRLEGLRTLTREQAEVELLYLEQKGLVDQPLKMVSPENSDWRITAAGRDFMATRGQ